MTKSILASFGSTRSSASIATEIHELQAMAGGRGWAVMLETLGQERERAISVITSSPSMGKEELDFYRASLRAIDMMIGLPAMIEMKLKGEFDIAITKEPKPDGTE